ncbi:MAG: hypothetical protein KGP28_08140 [Bdellovibrionales bacterium]|nr:hypothetical protein [Bdellovibrionales bacterium]
MKTQVSVWGSRFTMILISLGLFVPLLPAVSHPLLNPFQNRTGSHRGFLLEPQAGFFLTSENFDSDSARIPIPNSTTNSRFLFDLNASIGLTDDLFVFGRISAHSVRVSVLDQASQSSFGLADQLVGAAYRAFSSDSGIALNFQAEVSLPAYSNNDAKNSGKPYLGDGTIDVTGGAFLEFPLNSSREVYLEGGAGFSYRSKGFSANVPYSFKLKRDPAVKGFVFEGGMTGQISLKTDIATDDLAAQNILNQDRIAGSGGSNLVNALNPSFIQITGKAGFKNRYGQIIYLGAAAPVIGTNAAAGFTLFLGAALDFGPNPESKIQEDQNPGSPSRVSPIQVRSRPPTVSKKMGFTSYDLQAKIVNTNDQLYLVRIDKGSMEGVDQGQYFDIFSESAPVARAKVTQVKDEEAILSVIEYFQERSIEIGSSARRLVR